MKEKYVPLEKRSKRKQKEFHEIQRRGWGELSPITRKTANIKVYNRKKSERWHEYEPSVGFFCVIGKFMFRRGRWQSSRLPHFGRIAIRPYVMRRSLFFFLLFCFALGSGGGFFAFAGRINAFGSWPIKSLRPARIRAFFTIS